MTTGLNSKNTGFVIAFLLWIYSLIFSPLIKFSENRFKVNSLIVSDENISSPQIFAYQKLGNSGIKGILNYGLSYLSWLVAFFD